MDALVTCIFDRLSPVADVLETGELKFTEVMKFTPRKEIWGREGSCLEFVATRWGHKKKKEPKTWSCFTRVVTPFWPFNRGPITPFISCLVKILNTKKPRGQVSTEI